MDKKEDPSTLLGAGKIIIKGARTHNLKNISVEMPRNKMIVFTGLSGSGKSSLAFDTIFAEGQRKYVESLSAYARQFLRQMQKPDVDEISGLSPAISIDQKSRSNNPRSTVATITEIYDYLRVLYARIGHPHCPECGREVRRLSNEEILESVLHMVDDARSHVRPTRSNILTKGVSAAKIRISSPVVVGRKGEYYQLLYDLLNKGFEKVVIDDEEKSLRERIELRKHFKHSIDVVVDEIFVSEFTDDPKAARERASEAIERALAESEGLVKVTNAAGVSKVASAKFMCAYDGFSFPEIEPRLFSFNSPYGACPECKGLGSKYFFGDEPCDVCHGARLRPESLNVFLGTNDGFRKSIMIDLRNPSLPGLNIVEISSLSIQSAMDFFSKLKLTKKEEEISRVVIKEITNRLKFMLDVGIEYLTLDRKANTLSGGEAQRIRLASQLGSGLVGALYVLDEPTIGLHQRDNDKLIETLKRLRDLGNTVLIVEHDEDTIFASDYLVDLGPGAGTHGGNIVVSGWLDDLLTAKTNKSGSRTLAYLREETTIEMPDKRRTADRGKLKIRGGNKFNLKNINVDIPLAKLVAVTGVSGSGKSTFLYELLHRNLLARFDKRFRSAQIYNVKEFTGTEYLGRSILIDQSPIGRTPRSNPATYTGAWTHIRDMFAMSEEARARGWGPGRFSFNVKGGRCEACQGNGLVAVEMHFLPTVYVTCDVCNGKRFMKETIEVKYKKRNIHDILSMTVEEAHVFFEDIPAISDRLRSLLDVGLGYLELGQSATTLSGGEAQRVKIASELYRPLMTKTVYLLDEPTVGLHYDDVQKLVDILQKLVDRGNTVIVIEHNLDVLKCADHIIDLGPEGGDGGGKIIAHGTPEEVSKTDGSHTGHYLKRVLKKVKK
ncbi:MAG: Excinuclease ABC, subunit A [Candidatus Kaiserbacteria bacterium GW2011_GWB1_52_6]|uniref:UvrABC system protein A n=3 Tax=Candidatus Kaiseribacteriota TaxID=1752734 RepID=A0A0G2AE62_9BACT|nr:MAG: Excinuclease ABC, subunit A [Candidatus Kaiserbacteria bacterium GW2011_GWA2_52_12]KKW26529.1 MAG: Excinuclease ABC, subunit A [Candidatus Kaiserbacteria bacterium GW2011_GWB1_52_6]KKW30734.1 MAG: Excinuclease ABC, subunit A [Candidatus Kaiserbacteria bacterium GW2011_GWC2_52_8b]